ncbi:MAG: tetratricopeptide repeat-containing sensor histidine kinase [Bacteroidetes bacterium]|nr:tetratricopeptide repeat-containing sensor histidine kinase [Bacteroidota bacterium]
MKSSEIGIFSNKHKFRYLLMIFVLFIYFGLNAQTEIEKFKQSLPVSTKALQTELTFKIADYYLKGNNLDSTIKYANFGLTLISNSDKSNQYKFYHLLSDAYEIQVNPQKVIYFLNLMIKIAEDKKDKKSLSDLYLRIGMKYGRTYLYDKALYCFHNSSELYKQLNDSSGLSNAYWNLGYLYYTINDHKIAIENFQKSLDISLKIKDRKRTAYALRGFGNVYALALHNDNEALKYQFKALKLFEEINELKGFINTLSDIADSYRRLKQYKNAIVYYQKAIKANANNKDLRVTAFLFHRIGKAYLDMNDYQNAFVNLKHSEEIANNIGDIGLCRENYNQLSEWYAKNKDFSNAYEYHKRYTIANDSFNIIQNNEKLNQLKLKYENEGFENENQILKQKAVIQQLALEKQTYLRNTFIGVSVLITLLVLIVFYRFILKKKANKVLFEKSQQISIQKNKLEELYNTKNKLFAIITHDLKNPFGSLVSLSSFLESNYSKLEENHKYKGLVSLKRSIDEIYHLLINLTDWLNSKENKIKLNKTFFDLNSTIDSVLKLYRTTAEEKSIDLQMQLKPDILAYGDERMIKTILRNLIDNATKFTAANGKIEVKVEEDENRIIVSVSDTGVGISEVNKNKIFNLETDFNTLGGLGLILSKEFIEMNNGEIWFESEAGKGSTFYFTITKGVFYE